jgi:hypothetical protein
VGRREWPGSVCTFERAHQPGLLISWAQMSRRVPKDLADAIQKCWPEGVVEPFDIYESYFCEIGESVARDLRKIPGSSLRWQSEEDDSGSNWDDDRDDDWSRELPPDTPWQSYRMFFVAPNGEEFHYENAPDDIVGTDDVDEETWEDSGPDDEELEEWNENESAEGWLGCPVGISLRAPFAVVGFGELVRDEDYRYSCPDVHNFSYILKANRPSDPSQPAGEGLGEKSILKIEKLRTRIVQILSKYGIQTLDPSVLRLAIPRLVPGEEAFLEKPVRVLDSFFFQGL